MEPIYLSSGDLEKLKNKQIGMGSEAIVYNAGRGVLYKIYHNDISRKISSGLFDERMIKRYPSDDSDIKIVSEIKDIIPMRHIDKYFSYYDKENVRIHRNNAILMAIERQNKIEHTSLPIAPIFHENENKLLGCALKHHKRHYNLHSFSLLPRKTKIEILKKLLRNVEELLNANIYHVDLANKKVDKLSHSNVLLSLSLEPQIIDIDGRSAIYTEKPEESLDENEKKHLISRNQHLYNTSLASFSALLLDFIYGEDLVENNYENYLGIMLLYDRLEKQGLPRELAEVLVDGPVTLDALHETLNLKLKR